ncbi:GDSL-like lipase/acylhydrolase family protein [Streptomyces sp. 3212.3]|uniref:SGNH/GDSL hydrolase family protein n=1 Tax=Streptomyces sp. 3212.3 TaxID=1938846 RepID=UPI000E27FB89|nr:SGNH/GDSL hydrolase family protein [Streptomyces sp. 3212.3]REE62115.1 GDSL-like lipase/acylhydrolase family protein [Streptomyces sp. 3212.3]
MARHRFGGIADYVISVGAGNVATLQPGTSVTCWNAAVGGTQYTDLTDTDGTTPIVGGTLTANSSGSVPEFFGPDGVRSLYLDANGGSGPRRRTLTTDLDEDFDALQGATIPATTVTTAGDLLAGTGNAAVDRLAVGAPGQVLVPDPRAAPGVRWGNGWRRRDLPHAAVADALSAIAAPTVTVTKQATSTIASAQALLPPDSGPFLYLGAGSFTYGTGTPDSSYYLPLSRYPNTYQSGQANWAVEFCTDASVFEIKFKYIGSATRYRLSVDDQKITDLPQLTGATAGNEGSSHVLKFTFATAAPRKIRFDFTTMPFGGLFLPPGATAWKPAPRGGRLGIFGDSIDDGSAQNTGAGIGTWAYRAARMLGCSDVWDQARGGTGYITPGTFAALGDRVAGDIAPYAFDTLIVWAGYNDNQGDQGAIGTAAASLYAALKAAVAPGADIYVIGCWDPTGSPATSIQNTTATLKTAAANAKLPFINNLTGQVYDGQGNLVATQGPWMTTQIKAAYVGADNVHPTDAGHAYLARRVVDAIKALMPA